MHSMKTQIKIKQSFKKEEEKTVHMVAGRLWKDQTGLSVWCWLVGQSISQIYLLNDDRLQQINKILSQEYL